jgi:hypothetical protein
MNWLTSRLVDDWHRALGFWSVRLHAAAILYLTLYALVPAFPPEIANMLPSPFRAPVIGAYSVLSIVLRLVAQKKPNG